MSKFEQISAFLAVIEEKGFAAAARKIGLSTAAVSRKITNLENELNVQLIRRGTRQITLTESGMYYYQQCKKSLGEIADAEKTLTHSMNEAVGTLKIVCNRYLAMELLIPRLNQFMEQNPKLKIRIDLAERFPDFTREDIDILFGVTVEGAPELVRRKIETTRYVLCASPSYLKKYGTPKTPIDLKQHRYITHSIRQPANVISFKNGEEIFVEPCLWLNDNYAIRECAIQGMGIVKLHDYIVLEALKSKQLIEVLPERKDKELPLYLYYQHSRYLQPKIRRFIDFFLKDHV